MNYEWHDNGRFSLVISRYKNEAKYETFFIEKIKEDFAHHSYNGIKDAEIHLREIATYHKKPNDTHTVETGSNSKYVGGSIATKHVRIKIKPYGNFIVKIQEKFKPNECFK